MVLPPPPPPLQQSQEKSKKPQLCLNFVHNLPEELNRILATEKIKYGLGVEVFKSFHPIESILQEGPTCGMTALAMGLQDQNMTFTKLKDIAIENMWSCMGEMYSCDWMTKLATSVGAKTRLISNGIQNHLTCISHCLSKGGFLIVPYDKDKDHSPGCFQGASAHWAIVIGLLLVERETKSDSPISLSPCNCLEVENNPNGKMYGLAGCVPECQIRIQQDTFIFCSESSEADFSYVVPYVCALQGQSRHLKLWPFFQLAESNLNLREEGEARRGQVIVPPGGVEGGLCGQAVLLFPA